jgi:pimeloyl-ACP methyl ester carboxylesterase
VEPPTPPAGGVGWFHRSADSPPLVRSAHMHLDLDQRPRPIADDPRERLLAAMPVAERRLQLTGISTAVLEGGDGPPVVLLHGPGAMAAEWMRVIPDLVATHRVVAPDLPGHGASEVTGGRLDADRVLGWLGELIERTCATPPALVGHVLGGAIAARLASGRGDRLSGLVLVNPFGLARFRPPPSFAFALMRHAARPTERSFERLWRGCAADLDDLRGQMGEQWESLEAYALDLARTPSRKSSPCASSCESWACRRFRRRISSGSPFPRR